MKKLLKKTQLLILMLMLLVSCGTNERDVKNDIATIKDLYEKLNEPIDNNKELLSIYKSLEEIYSLWVENWGKGKKVEGFNKELFIDLHHDELDFTEKTLEAKLIFREDFEEILDNIRMEIEILEERQRQIEMYEQSESESMDKD